MDLSFLIKKLENSVVPSLEFFVFCFFIKRACYRRSAYHFFMVGVPHALSVVREKTSEV